MANDLLLVERISYFSFWSRTWQLIPGISCEHLDDIFCFLDTFQFQYVCLESAWSDEFINFLSWLSEKGAPKTLLRTELASDLDELLLESIVARFSEKQVSTRPMAFPLRKLKDSTRIRQYCFVGHDMKTCLFWTDEGHNCLGRSRLSCKVVEGERYTLSDCVLHAYDHLEFEYESQEDYDDNEDEDEQEDEDEKEGEEQD
ncbi:hypothetical protein AN958_09318 [Leucoagaricus sp. SymC.cos]|nr:hypothetical protein AN958_09318 [Leucoagaricus sp. SymC.cos]